MRSPLPRRRMSRPSHGLQVDGRSSSVQLAAHVVGNLLVLLQRLEPGAFHGAAVHEQVLGAVVGPDEAEAALDVERSDDTGGHKRSPCEVSPSRRRARRQISVREGLERALEGRMRSRDSKRFDRALWTFPRKPALRHPAPWVPSKKIPKHETATARTMVGATHASAPWPRSNPALLLVRAETRVGK